MLTSISIKNVDLLILVFDMTDPKSFMDLEKWLNILKNQFQEILKYQVPIMCIGNKNDIYKGKYVNFKIF